jgi:hypothetical protein
MIQRQSRVWPLRGLAAYCLKPHDREMTTRPLPLTKDSIRPHAAARYSGKYSDARGAQSITICNDGVRLSADIGGITFTGTDFDALAPNGDVTPEQLSVFSLHHNCLCACAFQWDMPIPLLDHGQEKISTLSIKLELGKPAPNGGLDRQKLLVVLRYNQQQIASCGLSGWFEDELMSIQRQLPNEVYLKACITCLFSDYSPLGHGSFGQLRCFRNVKQDYLKVRSKADYWSLHDRYDRLVQETYVCADFDRRIPGTGYRG